MPRGVGEFDLLEPVVADSPAVLSALLTQLGDVWFLASLLAVVYWPRRGRREATAVLSGTTLTGIAVVL